MAKKPPRIPSFRHHKAAGQGYVVLDGKYIYLGKYDLPETREKYHRLISEWLSTGHRPVPEHEVTVVELAAGYWRHARAYYRRSDGTATGEIDKVKRVIQYLKDLYGRIPAVEFGPRAFRAVRHQMIKDGDRSRGYINSMADRVKRMFKWGVGQQLIPPSVYEGLQSVPGLRLGRSGIREAEPVRPVPEEDIDAIRPVISRQVAALIDLQLLTAARPCEIVGLRPQDFDRSASVWICHPGHHKTAHYGHKRTIYFGPRAQVVIKSFMARAPHKPLFSPQEAEAERRAKQHKKRKTPLNQGNRPGTNQKQSAKRKPGEVYTVTSYRQAIQRGCEQIGVQKWSPNQLRHNAATRLRAEYGIDVTQTILGHRLGSGITEIYAEANISKARNVIEQIG